MALSTADKLFLVIGIIDITGLFAGIAYMLYLANTKMEMLQNCFKNSSGVTTLNSFRHGGACGKIMIIGGISGYVAFSTFYIKRGILSTEDLKKLPNSLKQKLIILQWSGIILLLTMFSLALVAELDIV